jgi:Flp pilus assembly protein TadB
MESPLAPLLIGAGLTMEAIGFFMVWRIAKIKI